MPAVRALVDTDSAPLLVPWYALLFYVLDHRQGTLSALRAAKHTQSSSCIWVGPQTSLKMRKGK